MWASKKHIFSSVQFSHTVVSDSLQPHGLQHTRLPCLSPTPRAYKKTHDHRVSDAIQLSCPLSSPFPPAFNISQHQGLCKWVSSSHQGPKYWSFSFSINPSNQDSGLVSFRTDQLYLLAVQGILESSPTPQLKSTKYVLHIGLSLTSF